MAIGKSTDKMALGDRLKMYEVQWENQIPVSQNIVIRIDGHKFSKYTKKFNRPFDDIMTYAMEETTKALVEEFQAVVGYTQSDEITLIIKAPTADKIEHYNKLEKQDINHAYNGRIQKIASLAGGFASMAFNKAFAYKVQYATEYFEEVIYEIDPTEAMEYTKYLDHMRTKVGNAWFDARVYAADDAEAVNSILWRVRDCVKNSKSMFAQEYCSHKELMYKTGDEQIELCEETSGKRWADSPDRFRWGIFVKKVQYEIKVDNEYRTGNVMRTKIISFPGMNYNYQELEDFVLKKVLTQEEHKNILLTYRP